MHPHEPPKRSSKPVWVGLFSGALAGPSAGLLFSWLTLPSGDGYFGAIGGALEQLCFGLCFGLFGGGALGAGIGWAVRESPTSCPRCRHDPP